MNGLRAPLRGGNWNIASSAGAAALNLNNEPTNRNSNIGFRAAFSQTCQMLAAYGLLSSALLNGSYILSRHLLKYGWALFFSRFYRKKGASQCL